jgi:hypothetical protein
MTIGSTSLKGEPACRRETEMATFLSWG